MNPRRFKAPNVKALELSPTQNLHGRKRFASVLESDTVRIANKGSARLPPPSVGLESPRLGLALWIDCAVKEVQDLIVGARNTYGSTPEL